jgi:hypothetical protein
VAQELSSAAGAGGAAAARIASRSAGVSSPSATNVAVAPSTVAAKPSAKGSALQIASSSEQPSGRSGFSTPEPSTRASRDQPFGHASAATGIESSPAVPVPSPPPATVGALRSSAPAPFATPTVTVIAG